jgi:hypothetical protein
MNHESMQNKKERGKRIHILNFSPLKNNRVSKINLILEHVKSFLLVELTKTSISDMSRHFALLAVFPLLASLIKMCSAIEITKSS